MRERILGHWRGLQKPPAEGGGAAVLAADADDVVHALADLDLEIGRREMAGIRARPAAVRTSFAREMDMDLGREATANGREPEETTARRAPPIPDAVA
jgi:hypothetical protein